MSYLEYLCEVVGVRYNRVESFVARRSFGRHFSDSENLQRI
jgi:hypothetical protein